MKTWLYSNEARPSEKNPGLRLKRALGAWEVEVSDTTQTGPYTNSMWKDAFRRVARARNPDVHTALLLGLGGGGAIRPLHERFLSVRLTAVEYDPAMVKIAKEIGLWKPFPFPNVILGDVREAVPALEKIFDIIILDVFEGNKLSPAVKDDSFLGLLGSRLTNGGVLVVNFSGHRDAIRKIAEKFPDGTIWKFRANTLGAFW